jgi:3-oxoacyl-[acyl-carrier-protein] synthase-3
MSGITIKGTGMYVPKKIITNDDLAALVDTSDEWITARTGIRRRRISTGEPAWQLGKQAALSALENAGVRPSEIDIIIACSVTNDFHTPSLACIIQGQIGADNAACFDVGAACSGFIFALDVAQKYLSFGVGQTVLIICAEVLSKITDYTDRSTCVLFGDGAGAAVVKKREGNLFESVIKSDGRAAGLLFARLAENSSPYVDAFERDSYRLFEGKVFDRLIMDGREVYRFAADTLSETLNTVCEKAGISVGDIDVIVPHQANVRIIRAAAARLDISMEKMYVNIEGFGNTSSASIPICLDELSRSGRLKRGDRLALVGFGAGLTSGAILMQW